MVFLLQADSEILLWHAPFTTKHRRIITMFLLIVNVFFTLRSFLILLLFRLICAKRHQIIKEYLISIQLDD